MTERGIPSTYEAVRKWIEGENLPRSSTVPTLAKLLGVDPSWLIYGPTSARPALDEAQVASPVALTVPALAVVRPVNPYHGIVAAFIEADGGVLQASSDDGFLRAAIRGASYSFVVLPGRADGDTVEFRQPPPSGGSESVLYLAVLRRADSLALDVAVIEADDFVPLGVADGDDRVLRLDIGQSGFWLNDRTWPSIRSFSTRL